MTTSEKTDIQESPKIIYAGYSAKHEDQRNTGPISDAAAWSIGSSPKASATSSTSFDINTKSHSMYLHCLPKVQIFRGLPRAATPPVMPNGRGVSYIPDDVAVAPMASAQHGVDINLFALPSMPYVLPYFSLFSRSYFSNSKLIQEL